MTDEVAEAWAAFEGDFTETASRKAQPVIKWAGGKRQLIPEIMKYVPEKIETYYESFIGGGALFWHLSNEGRFKRAVLNDWNPEIANLYEVIQKCPQDLMSSLDYATQAGFSREVYNEMRACDHKDMEPHEKATRTVYLNKCGFNGLYRQNKKGDFNVPWGKKDHVTLYDRGTVLACSEALQKAVIRVGDFAETLGTPQKGDLVYLDPPYVPHSDTSNFTSYTSEGFTLEDQKRVVAVFRRAADAGATVIASNNDTPLVRGLYDGFEIHSVLARRNINSKGDKRGSVGEVLVVYRP